MRPTHQNFEARFVRFFFVLGELGAKQKTEKKLWKKMARKDVRCVQPFEETFLGIHLFWGAWS